MSQTNPNCTPVDCECSPPGDFRLWFGIVISFLLVLSFLTVAYHHDVYSMGQLGVSLVFAGIALYYIGMPNWQILTQRRMAEAKDRQRVMDNLRK